MSRHVVEAALRHPDLPDLLTADSRQDLVDWTLRRVRFKVEPQTRTVRVWLNDCVISRGQQAILVNAIVETYLEEVAREQRGPVQARLKDLEARHPALRRGLNEQIGFILAAQARGIRAEGPLELVRRLERMIADREQTIEKLRAQLQEALPITLVEVARPERSSNEPWK